MNLSKNLHLVLVGSFWWYISTFKGTYITLWVHLNDLFPKRPNGRVVSKRTFLFVTHRKSRKKVHETWGPPFSRAQYHTTRQEINPVANTSLFSVLKMVRNNMPPLENGRGHQRGIDNMNCIILLLTRLNSLKTLIVIVTKQSSIRCSFFLT